MNMSQNCFLHHHLGNHYISDREVLYVAWYLRRCYNCVHQFSKSDHSIFHCCPSYRYAFGRTRPTIDTSNQVINPRGSIEDGIMRVSFTLPCNSDDERDVPLEGDRYILLAVGGVRNNDIAYHSLGRWISDLTTIKCGPG